MFVLSISPSPNSNDIYLVLSSISSNLIFNKIDFFFFLSFSLEFQMKQNNIFQPKFQFPVTCVFFLFAFNFKTFQIVSFTYLQSFSICFTCILSHHGFEYQRRYTIEIQVYRATHFMCIDFISCLLLVRSMFSSQLK